MKKAFEFIKGFFEIVLLFGVLFLMEINGDAKALREELENGR